MPDAKTYSGACHCGRVRFEATTDLVQVVACNCSICSKHGLMLDFRSAHRNFYLLFRREAISTEYQFNKHVIAHQSLPVLLRGRGRPRTRGYGPDGKEMVAVNVRCLDDVDVSYALAKAVRREKPLVSRRAAHHPSLKNTRYGVVPDALPSSARHLPLVQSVPPCTWTASNSTAL